MQEILRVLAHWPVTRRGANVHQISSPSSFSGAVVWRVEVDGERYALRQWQERMDAERLRRIHSFQTRLGEEGLPIVPILQRAEQGGATLLAHGGRWWELATWMPGVADFWRNPSPTRLEAAMRALAAIHRASAWELTGESASSQRGSPSLARRAERLSEIVKRDGELLWRRLAGAQRGDDVQRAQDALTLVAQLAPRQRARSAYWQTVTLPLQWRLGDVHHDHVLFTGDRVTGIIDFGAADVDSRAGDVARLLGSLVGDDPEGWRQGLAAYQAEHPMSPIEVAAVSFFDSTGTLISVANWLCWLWPDDPAVARAIADRPAALARLGRLIERLRVLAARGD